MKTFLQTAWRIFVFALFPLACQTGLAAVGFTVTPAAVSNTYSGPITLQVTGLTSGDTVVVQKFLDINTNGVIDAGDILFQQFRLTDGAASVFHNGSTTVTNLNVPGDTDTTAGQITAQLNIQTDFSQRIVGKYAYKLSSPSGAFSPITNFFTVTNFPYAQTITGNVVSNGTSTTLPNAVILLFQPSGDGENVQGGAVANNSGGYSVKVPTGTYSLAAFKSNFVANLGTAPSFTLGSGATTNANITLIPATRSISGTVKDSTTSAGLPGFLLPVQTQNGSLAVAFTDTNGNFAARVTASQWQIQVEDQSVDFYGYVRPGSDNDPVVDTTAGNVTNITIALPKATAIFYGSVKDNLGNPLPGIDVFSGENSGNGDNQYGQDSYTDANGNYFNGALATNGDWNVQISSQDNSGNYIFSQGADATFTNGQAVLQNFTALVAATQITGHVQDSDGNPISNVQVNGGANIGGLDYGASVDTDDNGDYSLNVANGDWNINLNCGGGDDSLDNILGNGDYQCPDSQDVAIANNDGTANFTVQLCSGVSIITASPLPDGTNGVYYNFQFNASSCNNNFTWSVNDPQDLPSGLTLYSGGAFNGTPTTSGTYNFTVHVDDNNGHTANQSLSLYIAGVSSPLQITTSFLPNGTNTEFYSQTLQASGGTPPYSWSIPDYSADPPANLTLATNGVLSGTLADSVGTHYFDVQVTDADSATVDQSLQLYIYSAPLPPLVITNTSLPNGTVGVAYSVQLGATGGQPPYSWQLAIGSATLPAGLSLDSSGLISGTPTTNKVSTFKVQVTDSSVSDFPTNKVLSITIARPTAPIISSPAHFSGGRFQMTVTNVANINYTVQMSTNISSPNWIPVLVTNPSSSSFQFNDGNATNQQRFYRVLTGP